VQLGFNALAQLPESAVAELLSALESVKPMASIEQLARQIAAKTPSMNAKQAADITFAVTSLTSGPTDTSDGASQFLQDVLDSLYGLESPPTMPREQFATRLLPLTNIQAIAASGRAASLLTDHAKVMLDARVLSDLRPVFSPTDPSDLRGAVLVHTLQITFRESARTSDFFVALDTADLTKLTETLVRAQAKAVRLNEFASTAKLMIFDVEENSGNT